MHKLSKTAKILSILLNILCWGTFLGSLFYGILTTRSCFHLMTSDGTGTSFVSGITLDYMEFYSSTGGISIPNDAMLKMSLTSLIVYFVQVPLTCYGIQLLRKVLRPMIQQRPFSGTGNILQKLGCISLLVAVIENVTDWVMVYIMENHYHLSDLFLGSIITDVTFHFQPDTTFLSIAIVVFVLSGVFRYGEELQQLSDETL